MNLPEEHIESMTPDQLRDHGQPKDDITEYNLSERKRNATAKQNTARA
jgi:hypothetical protein